MEDFNARKALLSDSLGGSINDLQFLTNSTDLNSNLDLEYVCVCRFSCIHTVF